MSGAQIHQIHQFHVLLSMLLAGRSCLWFIDEIYQVTTQLSRPLACSTINRVGYTLQRFPRLALWFLNPYRYFSFQLLFAEPLSIDCKEGQHHVRLFSNGRPTYESRPLQD
jgi:hypothetical protein